jgi:hypothetical protein
LKGLGLGKLMMEKIVPSREGIGQLSGMTMPSNGINLAKRLGFKIDIQLEDGIVNMELPMLIKLYNDTIVVPLQNDGCILQPVMCLQ